MSVLTKKKREAKTSAEQYDLYLEEMETDEVFRTGTINPNLPPDYIDKVWKKLTNRLNACDSGPVLEWNAWKTRFTNWKNSTRAKYRSKVMDVKKTGGGSPSDIHLTQQEERGLNVWGRVTLAGSAKVPVCGGLQDIAIAAVCTEDNNNNYVHTESEQVPNIVIEETMVDGIYEQLGAIFEDDHLQHVEESTPVGVSAPESIRVPNDIPKRKLLKRKYFDPQQKGNNPRLKPKVTENRTIKAIGEELLMLYRDNTTAETDRKNMDERKLNLEVNKLRFEIAKYKYEHPDFEFELQ